MFYIHWTKQIIQFTMLDNAKMEMLKRMSSLFDPHIYRYYIHSKISDD